MPKLKSIMRYVKEIDKMIKDLRKGMAHSHPYSVDALRQYVDELEAIREVIMESGLESGENLDTLMYKIRECIRECVRPSYARKPQVLPYPKPDPWVPPVTVTGVNIIFVVDISESMFEGGGLEPGGRVRNLLVATANEIERYAKAAKIPCKVSLVAYADPTDRAGENRPNFWRILLNKSVDVQGLAQAFSDIGTLTFKRGSDFPESGMSAIYHSIDQVIDKSVVNGKPVENSLILVSDDRQKLEGSSEPSHRLYKEVTYDQVDGKLNSLKVFNRYALVPMKTIYTVLPGRKGPGKIGPGNWNSPIIPFFRQCREYFHVSTLKDVSDWITWTLDPTKAPKKK
ncbi:hypothetical protein P4V05_14430 [Bacillus thuringiensis]|uniref:hypothetical protein n=1 Tax=Bacillus TaxID=1386 RepID=UPI00089E1C23|nr:MULTISPECIES: hypothetical protein [Bacillus]MBK5496680.1 hypothetical protein [Bacillus sp. TH13]MED1901349.1 hypothetical protein [Bacillus thuringiensis]PGS86428.1 hypothetical protein COD02_03820 [Bacillus thuringiensis]SEG45808.1 hypothetical protein SAMN04487919_110104 [Bacillus sp. ok061]